MKKIAVILLLLILGLILFFTFVFPIIPAIAGNMEDRKQQAKTISKLRTLYTATSDYLTANKEWPQCPFDPETNREKFEQWWKDALEPHGMPKNAWVVKNRDTTTTFRPARFESGTVEPFKDPKKWWFQTEGETLEKIAVFPDGSVETIAGPGNPIE